MEVPGARRARGARGFHERVWPEDRAGARDVVGCLPVEHRCSLPPDARAVVVEQRLAHGQRLDDGNRVARELVLRPDAAPQEDRGREVRTRREHDGAGVDPLARRREHALGTRPVQHEPVDRCLGEHAQVRPRAGRVEVRESRVPARPLDDVRRKRRPADRLRGIVGVVEHVEARVTRRLEERDVERRGLGRVGGEDAKHVARAGEVGRERLVPPGVAPFVIVGGRPDDRHACVVGGAAADHAGAERAVVLAARAPVVREAEGARVEQVVRPGAGAAGAVVGASLDQADATVGILRQTRREDAPRGAAADDRHVVHHQRSIRPQIQGRLRAPAAYGKP